MSVDRVRYSLANLRAVVQKNNRQQPISDEDLKTIFYFHLGVLFGGVACILHEDMYILPLMYGGGMTVGLGVFLWLLGIKVR